MTMIRGITIVELIKAIFAVVRAGKATCYAEFPELAYVKIEDVRKEFRKIRRTKRRLRNEQRS